MVDGFITAGERREEEANAVGASWRIVTVPNRLILGISRIIRERNTRFITDATAIVAGHRRAVKEREKRQWFNFVD